MDVSSIHNIPGYVEILRFVLKTQIQNLVEQLRDHGGEETLVLSANLTAGTISHLGSDKGQGFLEARDDIRSHFLTHCLQGNQNYHTAHHPGNSSHDKALKNLPGIGRRDTYVNLPQQGSKFNSNTSKQLDICAGHGLVVSSHSAGVATHGPGLKSMNLPTIDQATVRDMIRLPIDTQISRITELGHHNTLNDVNLSIPVTSKLQSKPDTIHGLTTQQVHSSSSSITKQSSKSIFSPIIPESRVSMSSETASIGVKLLSDSNLLPSLGGPFTRLMPEVPLPIHTGSVIREPVAMATKSNEHVSKTKRKQRQRSEIQVKPEPIETMAKKAKMYESLINPNSLVTIVPPTSCNDIPASQVVKVTASSLSDNRRNSTSSDSNVGSTGISLLNMQPVLLLNDTNIGDIQSQNVYIESPMSGQPMKRAVTETYRSSTIETTGMTSLISGNKFTADTREKDKTKKTLSSKIDEITQRITKDDAIKQHTVHTKITEFSLSPACPPVYSNSSASEGGGINDSAILNAVGTGDHTEDSGSLTTIDVSSPDNCTGSSIEHLGDSEGKCKDGSRASHRKPKLPRYNIGVASDDDDNGDSSQCSSPQTPALINTMVTTPSSVGINHDDTQDIINIQVSNDDSETSFPHINLEELADGLLLTDIPIVSYYNSVEEPNKSVIESVFNLKPGRDPSTKKPLNSQSIIVSGSKSEKDWVKCPMCPDKFLTVEALQFHITNVNHTSKKNECDLCGRKFGQLRDMERHRRIHTGERPFTCDICKKSFSRKDNLKSHRKKHSIIL